jgi:hypothetical protein
MKRQVIPNCIRAAFLLISACRAVVAAPPPKISGTTPTFFMAMDSMAATQPSICWENVAGCSW